MPGGIAGFFVVEPVRAGPPVVVVGPRAAMVEMPLVADLNRRAHDRYHVSIPVLAAAGREEGAPRVGRPPVEAVMAVEQPYFHFVVDVVEHPERPEMQAADTELAKPVMGGVE